MWKVLIMLFNSIMTKKNTDEHYVFRTQLAIIDLNNNVNRPVTSIREQTDVCSLKKGSNKGFETKIL